MEHAFDFPDYSDDELLRILRAKARTAGLRLGLGVAKRAVAALARARARPHFGNAGAVENMLSEAKLRLKEGADELDAAALGLPEEEQDDGPGGGGGEAAVARVLEGLVGCRSLRERLAALQGATRLALARGDDPRWAAGLNLVLTGGRGCGKTTVARRLGPLLRGLGLLPDDTVTEVSAADLVTGYAGQTGRMTRDILQRARGGVVVIDEAQQLDPARGGAYMAEAADELARCLSSAEFEGRLAVVLVGPGPEMRAMLAAHRGLAARFPDRLELEDLGAEEVAELALRGLTRRGIGIEPGDRAAIAELAGRLVRGEGFANGRDAEAWSAAAYRQVRAGRALGEQRRPLGGVW